MSEYSTYSSNKQPDNEAKRRQCAQCKAFAAWRYRVDFNWDVRPAYDRTKRPNVLWSEENAPEPLDPDDIWERWWDDPSLNIILLTGKRSGIIVGDIDPRHGGALETLWRMGWPRETVIAASPSGGWHVYAAYPPDGLCSVPNYAQGIELKADGAVIVAPPSRHPNGQLYRWLDGHDPWTLAPAVLPEPVLADIRARRAPVKPTSEPVELSENQLRALSRYAKRLVKHAVQRACDGRDGGRHNTGLWLACQLRDLRVSDDVGRSAMLAYQRELEKRGCDMPNAAHAYPAGEATGQWDSVKDSARRAPPNGAYPATDLDSKLGLDVLVDRVLRALADANNPARYEPRVFVRGGKLVRVHLDEDGRPSVVTLERAGLAVEIARVVHFTKELRGSIAPCYPPELVVRAVLNASEYQEIPALAGMTEMPVLRADGSVLATAGYDPTTRLIYHPVPGADAIPTVADRPTDEQVAAALTLVWDALRDFPFETRADRANALALLLTPVLRPAIHGQVPLALIDAPRAGTGKSLIAKIIATITVGHHRGMMTEAENDAEWRKKISATLLAGHPINIIDNVTLPLKSGALSSVISEPVWGDRQLGVMQMLSLPSRAVWIATGNNIRVGGDLPRRTYRVRLNAKKAQPWTRDTSAFTHPDLLAWVEQKRADLVHALLTIARASMVRDAPALTFPTMGGFEEWVRVVGRAVALDAEVRAHFLGDVEASWANEDTEALEWEAFLTSWYARFAYADVTAKQIHDEMRYDKTMERRANPALYDALPEALADAVDRAAFGTKLGTALNQHRDTRYGDEEYRLTRGERDLHTHAVRWRVERGGESDGVIDTGTKTSPA